uniref:taste receptor cell protein 1 n=1 Tax=Jaculus jaculus TaxID=51337 RepID=UPI001E1B2C27|nr:taste receptor cell protein 1 [Jaculus jaculus]
MGERWCPAAGMLLAAPKKPPAYRECGKKNEGQFPSAPGGSSVQHHSKVLLGFQPIDIVDNFISVEQEKGAPGMGTETLSPEAFRSLEFSSQPVPLGLTRASSRDTTGPSRSGLPASAVKTTPKSNLTSSGGEPTEKTLSPGSLETNDTLLPLVLDAFGKKCSKASGFCVTIPAPASATVKTVTPRPMWLSSRAPVASVIPVNRSGHPHLLQPIFIPSVQTLSWWGADHTKPKASSTVTSTPRATLGPPLFGRMANTLAATKPLPTVAPRRPGLDGPPPPVTTGSGSSRDTEASGLEAGPSDGSTLHLVPSAPPWPLSPSFSPQPSPALPPPSPLPALVSPLVAETSDSPVPSASAFTPSTPRLSLKTSSLAPGLSPRMTRRPTQGTVRSWPGGPSSPASTTTLSFQLSSSLLHAPPSSGSPSIPKGADSTQTPVLPYPGQDASLQDPESSNPGPNDVVRSVAFRINGGGFAAAVWNLTRPEHRVLIHYRLQLIYSEAFPSFKTVGALLLQPGSADVNASLVFGQPGPSACEVLWAFYRKVRATRWLLGYLPLKESSLASDGFNLTHLALETIDINFTVMSPFVPRLLLPGSHPFVLLERQILRLVTPEVTVFYRMLPQKGPLLLFSNANQWVSVYMEYKFQRPLPTHLKGLASHLAHHITDPILQKSTIVANGEKAEVTLFEVRLLILDYPFTMALGNKTSPESQELQKQLTKWLTSLFRSLQNFGQVVVVEFQLDPLIAKVHAAFLGAAPARTHIEACVRQALGFLQEAEGLHAEMLTSHLGVPSSGVSSNPSCVLVLSLLLVTCLLVAALAEGKGLFWVPGVIPTTTL